MKKNNNNKIKFDELETQLICGELWSKHSGYPPVLVVWILPYVLKFILHDLMGGVQIYPNRGGAHK